MTLLSMKHAITVIMVVLSLLSFETSAYAQLRKSSETEKIKSFTNGSVILFKTTIEDIELYAVTLPNANSRLFDDVVLWLGNKEEMLQNLKDFNAALENGKKGESFDFSANGQSYHLLYHKVLGQVCFRVFEEISTSEDYGSLFQATIVDIIEFIEGINK